MKKGKRGLTFIKPKKCAVLEEQLFDLENQVFDLENQVERRMSIYKTALEEGRKIGYAEGYRTAWAEIKPTIEALEKTAKEVR